MDEIPYGGVGTQGTTRNPGTLPAAPPTTDAGSTQELAQLILMGMQHDIDARIDWRLQGQQPRKQGVTGHELGLILGSIGMGIPLTAIAGAAAGLPGIIIVWIGLILINVAWAARRQA